LGATSPAAKLDVVGSAGIRVNEDGAGTKVISIRSNFAGVDPAINVSTNNALLLQTNNTERMRITSGGNVGIGNTSALAKLHATGNILSYTEAANTASLFISANNSYNWQFGIGNNSNFVITENGGLNAIGTERLSITSGGAATFSNNVTIGDQFLIGSTATLNGAMNFIKTNASPVASRLTFGTDGTGYKFAIAKNVSNTITDLFTLQDNGVATFSSTASATAFIPTGSSVPTIGMYSSAANTLDFATNTTNKLSISSTGTATFSGDVYATGFIGALETSNNIRFNQTLSTSSSGASGNYLTINCNGVLYKLELLTT